MDEKCADRFGSNGPALPFQSSRQLFDGAVRMPYEVHQDQDRIAIRGPVVTGLGLLCQTVVSLFFVEVGVGRKPDDAPFHLFPTEQRVVAKMGDDPDSESHKTALEYT